MHTRAAILEERSGPLRVETVDLTDPGPGEVRVRVEACLIGCGVMTGFGAAVSTAKVRPGEYIAVFGCGGVGLAAIQGGRIAGAVEIIAVDPLPSRRALASQVGATVTLDADGAPGEILARTGDGVDVAIEGVGTHTRVVITFD